VFSRHCCSTQRALVPWWRIDDRESMTENRLEVVMSLEGRVALITGGGTGIGRATGLALAHGGCHVAVNYSRSKAEAERTVKDVEALGVKAFAVQADVSDDASVKNMVEAVHSRLGRLDILVNNAGYTQFVPLEDLDGLTDEIWSRVLDVNVLGTFYCTRAAVPYLKRAGTQDPCVVNVASIAGMTAAGSSIAYCASKAAIISMTKTLARSLAPAIRVNAVSPGFVDTRWVAGWDEFRQVNAEATPMKRIARPEDIAEVIVSLAGSAGFVTGQNVVVDGGKIL